MNFDEYLPLVVFDDQCYLCGQFIKIINVLARNKITIIGHYSDFGKKIRSEILDESALDMFWFIEKKVAYGGRAALLPLIKAIISNKSKKLPLTKINNDCQQECKTIKAVFLRSFSLISNSKKINL
jgi:predicted DCC family thiol-disulfide oxidoreductase YuxK